MAVFYITHQTYPDNPQLFTINISQIVKIQGEPNTDFSRDHLGDSFWEISVATSGVGFDGNIVPSIWVDVKTDEVSVDALVQKKISELCALIDWSQQGRFSEQEDKYAPVITEQYPLSGQTGVPIESTIRLVIEETLPSKGLDVGTLSFKVKGIPVQPTVTGSPYKYTITYSPTALK